MVSHGKQSPGRGERPGVFLSEHCAGPAPDPGDRGEGSSHSLLISRDVLPWPLSPSLLKPAGPALLLR